METREEALKEYALEDDELDPRIHVMHLLPDIPPDVKRVGNYMRDMGMDTMNMDDDEL